MPNDDDQRADAPTVTFNYIKSAFYRVVHVDGAIGGITPRGLIHCSIYSERVVIPRVTRQPINPDGSLGDVTIIESRDGISREMEADLIFDERTAREFRDWLDRQLDRLAELRKAEGSK